MNEKSFTDKEIRDAMRDLAVWHVGSGLRLMGKFERIANADYLTNVVRIDMDVIGRTQHGQILKSPTLASVDYSLTPIPKYFVQKDKPHYWIADLDDESAVATTKVYLAFCHDLNNWKESQGPQMVVPVRPGAMDQLNKMASMMPGVKPHK